MHTVASDLQDQIAELNERLAFNLTQAPEFRNLRRIAELEEQLVELEGQLEEIQGNS